MASRESDMEMQKNSLLLATLAVLSESLLRATTESESLSQSPHPSFQSSILLLWTPAQIFTNNTNKYLLTIFTNRIILELLYTLQYCFSSDITYLIGN